MSPNDILPVLAHGQRDDPQPSLKRKRTGNTVYTAAAAAASPSRRPRKTDDDPRVSPSRSASLYDRDRDPFSTPQSSPKKSARDHLSHLSHSAKTPLVRTRTEPVVGSATNSGSPAASNSMVEFESMPWSSSSTPVQHRDRPSTSSTTSSTPTRTYASKSRSFLIALPPSKLGSLGLALPPDMNGDSDGVKNDIGDDDYNDDDPTGGESQESYTDLRTRWGVDVSESEPVDVLSPSPSKRKTKGLSPSASLDAVSSLGLVNELKTVSELREKGESRRFHDEIGYLFEGLDPKNSIGLRRAGAVEIITKLGDPKFVRKAKASDFLGHAWDVLRRAGAGQGDQVLEAVLACFAALAAQEPNFLFLKLAHQPDFVSMLLSVYLSVDRKRDVLARVFSSGTVKKLSIRAADQAHFKILSDVIVRSGLFPEKSGITTRLLITHTLLSLPPSLFHPKHVSVLRRALVSELSFMRPVSDGYLAGRSLPVDFYSHEDCDVPSFELIDHLLRLMDSFILEKWRSGGDSTDGVSEDKKNALNREDDDDELARGLVSLCLVAEAIRLKASDQLHSKEDIGHGCTEYALRVLVSLTQRSQGWNERLLRQDLFLPFLMRTILRSHGEYLDHIVRGKSEGESQALNDLCLALGICTNLVQGCEDAKVVYREIRIDPECTGKWECIRQCCCENHRTSSALCCLAYVYVRLKEAANDDDGSDDDHHHGHEHPTLDFLRGHLAVLFGLLMRGDDCNQTALLRDLPGASRSIKIDALLHQAREFVAVYAAFRSRLTVAATKGGGDDVQGIGVGCWGQVDSVIRDGKKAENAAHDVVLFLENLYCASMDS